MLWGLYIIHTQANHRHRKLSQNVTLNILGNVSTFLFNTSVYTNDYSSTHLQKSYITKDLDDKAST